MIVKIYHMRMTIYVNRWHWITIVNKQKPYNRTLELVAKYKAAAQPNAWTTSTQLAPKQI